MKGDFVLKFIEGIIEIGKDLHEFSQWQPIYYKGVRVIGRDRKKLYSGFKNLERRGLIRIENKKYKFTKNGREWLQKSKIKYFNLKNKKWDRKWRIIIFDIPESMHKERNWLRRKLNNLGFYMLQKSVFVFPYSCEEELSELCQNAEIENYVNILIAVSLGSKEKEIRNYFDL